MPIHAIDAAMSSAVEAAGWQPGNTGENRVIQALRAIGLQSGDVQQQFRVGPYRLDFAWPRERMCIEADGWVHTTRDQIKRDKVRDDLLTAWGWIVCRVDIDQDGDRLQAEVAQIVQDIPMACVRRAETDIKDYGPRLDAIRAHRRAKWQPQT